MPTRLVYHYLVDVFQQKIYPAEISIQDGRILHIKETDQPCEHYILPGFVDAHIHIESSMLIPSSFAGLAVKHGTVATVSDPHEIANVCGIQGIEFMIDNAKKVPFKFHFGAPSCVPATSFETAGETIDASAIELLMQRDDIYYLSEMMNYPGVLSGNEEVLKKIAIAKMNHKPVDGHAPGLRGEKAKQYIQAGISTDHECFTKEEALEKLSLGMKILIREGSAAKNFDALIDLLNDHEDDIMFCCDDKHPDELLLFHINDHVKRAIDQGIDLFKVLKAACINPVQHYKLPVGLLRENDAADYIVVDNLSDFKILETCIDGEQVYRNEQSQLKHIEVAAINQFHCSKKTIDELSISSNNSTNLLKVIEALDGQLITKTYLTTAKIVDQKIVSDIEHDVLKIVVVNRYKDAPIAKAFIKNFNLKRGAIASTIAHDSHNIICVGTSDEEILLAVNTLIKLKGGIAVADGSKLYEMPLNVAGLMSNEPAEKVAADYTMMDQHAKALGCKLKAPFMTLSFMALLVIPQLKLSDKGLFDGEQFDFVDMQ